MPNNKILSIYAIIFLILPHNLNEMRHLLFVILLFCASLNIAAQSNISDYSLRVVYKKGDASVIRATKDNEEKYVIKIQQTKVKAMFIALGTKGDAIITLQSFLDRPKVLTQLYKLDNPSNNIAGCFLKESNASTLVRFYEGLNLNNYGVIPLKKLKKIVKWMKKA